MLSVPLGSVVGARLLARAIRVAYSPDQPRDEQGQWTSTGSTYFHGTVAEVLAGIKRDGLKAHEDNTTPDVYLTRDKDHAEVYAVVKSRRERNLTPVILEVEIPADRESEVRGGGFDPKAVTFPRSIPPEWIKAVHTYDAHGKVGQKWTREEFKALEALEAVRIFAVILINSSNRALAAAHPLVAVADRHAAKIEVAVRYAFALGRRQLPNVDKAADAVEQALERQLPKALLKAAEDGADAVEIRAAEALRTARVSKLSTREQAARDWAKTYGAELVKGISETTRERLRDALVSHAGDPKARLEALKRAVGDEERARVIARTESMRAVHKGQQLAWQEAQDEGLLPTDARRVWIVTEDDKLCPICEPLDGKTARLDDAYDGGDQYYDGPPAHPNCRCTEGIA